jgi:hypothetical protein
MPRKKRDPGRQGPAVATGTGSRGHPEVVGSKKEAVRRALQALGPRARAADIQAWVREHFGMDVPAAIAGTYKRVRRYSGPSLPACSPTAWRHASTAGARSRAASSGLRRWRRKMPSAVRALEVCWLRREGAESRIQVSREGAIDDPLEDLEDIRK